MAPDSDIIPYQLLVSCVTPDPVSSSGVMPLGGKKKKDSCLVTVSLMFAGGDVCVCVCVCAWVEGGGGGGG